MTTKNLPTHHPAETLAIAPESLEVANAYLQCQDINKTAEELDLPREMVVATLQRREVKAYIDNVFLNVGFNNRFMLREAMDAIIKKKFQELDESDMGSTKDIAELLMMSHKMTMDVLDRQIALEKLQQSNVKNQVNVQINDSGSNYGNLLDKLLNNNV